MLICRVCGCTFDEPTEEIGEVYAGSREKWYVCPSCGDGDFVEARVCDCCGEYVPDLHDDLDMCDSCFALTLRQIENEIENSENKRARKAMREVYAYLREAV